MRLGFDAGGPTILADTAAKTRLLERLRTVGITGSSVRTAILTAGNRARIPEEDLETLITQLRPHVVQSAAPASATSGTSGVPTPTLPRLHVTVADSGQALVGLHESLHRSGHVVLGAGNQRPDLVIRAIRFLEPLEWTQRWLIEDVPHLLMRFTDRTIRVGPLITGAGAPCHTCEALALVEKDPALPTLAAQLIGERPATEHLDGTRIAVAHAISLLHAWQRGAPEVHRDQFIISFRGAGTTVTRRRIRRHPKCDCGLQTATRLPEQSGRAQLRQRRHPTAATDLVRG